MPVSLASLRTLITEDAAEERSLSDLVGLGFKVDAWPENGVALLLVKLAAKIVSRGSEVVSAMSRIPFLADCPDDALEEHARQNYGVEPFPASAAVLTLSVRNLTTASVVDNWPFRQTAAADEGEDDAEKEKPEDKAEEDEDKETEDDESKEEASDEDDESDDEEEEAIDPDADLTAPDQA